MFGKSSCCRDDELHIEKKKTKNKKTVQMKNTERQCQWIVNWSKVRMPSFVQLEVLPYQLFIFYEYEVLNEKKNGNVTTMICYSSWIINTIIYHSDISGLQINSHGESEVSDQSKFIIWTDARVW